ncbi:MAG: electron transfer flavoprotein subunit alpha, partial [Chloroflexi bacterium]|nr:electron transfer flavoprotein subunit alpha [Chloroflexota bacterium]
MTNSVWVYVDQFKGAALPASWETLGAARKLAGELGTGVTAIVLGHNVEGIAKETFYYGADAVTLCDDATLADFRVRPYAAVLAKLADDAKPQVVLGPATTRARDVFGFV